MTGELSQDLVHTRGWTLWIWKLGIWELRCRIHDLRLGSVQRQGTACRVLSDSLFSSLQMPSSWVWEWFILRERAFASELRYPILRSSDGEDLLWRSFFMALLIYGAMASYTGLERVEVTESKAWTQRDVLTIVPSASFRSLQLPSVMSSEYVSRQSQGQKNCWENRGNRRRSIVASTIATGCANLAWEQRGIRDDLGQCDISYIHYGALHWLAEKLIVSSNSINLCFGKCCSHGSNWSVSSSPMRSSSVAL